MKRISTAVVLFSVMALFTMPTKSLAQSSSDTLIVPASPPGAFYNTIMGDTTATGARKDSNRVYVLQQTGKQDTTYFLTNTMFINFNLVVIGKDNPNTGNPPVLEPFINQDGSTPSVLFMSSGGKVEFKNVYFLGTRTDGQTVTGIPIASNGDSVTVILDHDVFDNLEQGGSPNLITFNGYGNKVFVTNCEFRNLQASNPQSPGIVFESGQTTLDTAVFKNNTFFCTAGSVIGSPGYVGYIDLDHNTLFLGTESGVISVKQLVSGEIRNNIFYGLYCMGLDSAQIKGVSAHFFGPPAIIGLDTLTTLKNAPFNLTAADRKITIENNDYCWPKAFYDNWKALNSPDSADFVGKLVGPIVPPTFLSSTAPDMFTNHKKWPGIVVADNDSTDPEFAASLLDPGIDSLINYCYTARTNGTGSGSWYQFVTNPLDKFAGVPADWATTQGYPVPENLAYSDDSLKSAGTGHYALGDLNWFPSQLKEYEAGDQLNAVETSGRQVPQKFSLSQNYPNPFNPTTVIRISLRQSGVMSLKVYNVLGQLVDVVSQGFRPAGEYTLSINMDRFASGVYFYTLREGANAITKKMLLLK